MLMVFITAWLLLVVVLLLLVIAIFVYIYSLLVTGAPFIPLPDESVDIVIKTLGLRDGSVFYDLGSGNGKIILAAAKVEPQAYCFGVDKAIAAHVAAIFAIKKAGNPPNVKLLRKNFFTADLSDATHVFCFLFPGLIAQLEEKFQTELTPGSRVVACDYKLPNKVPSEVITISNKAKFGKTLFVYEY